MGMYDDIQGEVKCLKCGKEFVAQEQIKWADCMLRMYNVGDSIPAEDGEYDYATYIRPTMDDQCPFCHTWQHFKATVKDGILTKLETTSLFTEEELGRLYDWAKGITENDGICRKS